MNKISIKTITSWKVLVPALIVAVVAIMAATFVVKSNADYICTRIIDDESACSIDEWSAWTDVGDGDPEVGAQPGTTYEVEQSRVGTGTKILSRVIEYLNRRTNCDAGFTGVLSGTGGGGASGYIGGGRTFTTSAVCQIEESRTITRRVPGGENDPECVNIGDPGCDVGIGHTVATETTGAIVTGGDEQILDGIDEINNFRRTMVDANIAVVPALVRHYGDTAEVQWNSREMTSCGVEGDNGDQWLPITEDILDDNGDILQHVDMRTAGRETTSPINGRTVYTLTCTTFEGETVIEQVVVNRVPVVNEE